MKWIYGIFFFLIGVSLTGLQEAHYSPSHTSSFEISAQASTSVDVAGISFTEFSSSLLRRSRPNSIGFQRFKLDRYYLEGKAPGLIFWICKLTRSYTELHISTYLKQLILYTIQVNAP